MTVLEFPPSSNHLYKKNKFGSIYKTKDGKAYEAKAAWAIRANSKVVKEGRVRVNYYVWYPDNRVRDNSNLLKILDDSVKTSGVIRDDRWQYYPITYVEAKGIDRENPRVEIEIIELA